MLIVLSSCDSGSREADALLDTIDSLSTTRPDSALILLDGINVGAGPVPALSAASLSRRQLMRMELLRARAMNKAYVDFTTDSVLLTVTDYYDSHGKPNERMEAHYLLGCAYRDMGEAPQALQCYQDAVDIVDPEDNQCDYRLLARVHGQMAVLFFSQALYRNALDSYRQSNKYAWKGNDTLTAVLALGQYTDCYYAMGDTDSTLIAFDETYRMLEKYGYSNYANTFLSIPIYILLSRKEFAEAKRYLDIYEHESAVSEDSSGSIIEYRKLNYYKGLYYAGIGKPDSAAYCLRLFSEQSDIVSDRQLAYSELYSLYEQEGKRDSLGKYIRLYKECLDSTLRTVETSRLQDLHSLYNYTRHQYAASKELARAERFKSWLWICEMALVVLGLSTWLYIVHLREEKKGRLRFLQDQYLAGVLQQKPFDAGNVMSQDVGKEIETIDFENIIYSMPIVISLHEHAKKNTSVPGIVWNELSDSIRPHMPHFMERVESFGLRKSSKGYRLCILTRLHFSLQEIGALLDMSPQALNNMRRRMDIKLFEGEGQAQVFDEKIICIPR